MDLHLSVFLSVAKIDHFETRSQDIDYKDIFFHLCESLNGFSNCYILRKPLDIDYMDMVFHLSGFLSVSSNHPFRKGLRTLNESIWLLHECILKCFSKL